MTDRNVAVHWIALLFLDVTVLTACRDDATLGPTASRAEIEITVEGLATLDPATEGTFEAWVVNADGQIFSIGKFDGRDAVIAAPSPIPDPTHIMLTVEPPDDADDAPSLMKLMGGSFAVDGTARLDVTGYLTPIGIPIEASPGVHVLGNASAGIIAGATPDAGLWLVDTRVDSTDASFFQTFTPLTKGWAYEGWVVRDIGSANEVWLSYGQFQPNNIRKARFRDDTGIGPFSGFVDYERALMTEVHYPGDDWVMNVHGYPVPGGVALPLDLNGDAAAGVASRWTHIITIEPRPESNGVRLEVPWQARPFFLRPYRNDIGEADPEQPRTIGFVAESLLRGSARLIVQ